MEGDFLGQGQVSGEATSAHSSSLAVRQFVAVAFGWVPVHPPTTPFRVEAVKVEEGYCLKCCAVHNFDVVVGCQAQAAFCRGCGMEFGGRI